MKICFWSIGDRKHAPIVQTLVDSFRTVGMKEDFHVYSDQEIRNACTHKTPRFDRKHHLFKFAFLQEKVKELDYDLFIFLDSDSYFVRNPGSLQPLMAGDPMHAFFESDCTVPSDLCRIWQGCPLTEYVRLMRECGVASEKVYNVNAGFFMIKKEAIDIACTLALDFWEYATRQGHFFTEEAPLAYAAHMLCVKPEDHLLKDHFDVWCSDWEGIYAGKLPDGKDWIFRDYLSGEKYIVNPAIVHAIRSKQAMAYRSTM